MASKKLNFWAIVVSTIFIFFANLQVLGGEKPRVWVGARFGKTLDLVSKTTTARSPFFGGIDLSVEFPLEKDVDEDVSTFIGLSSGVQFHTKGEFEQKWTYDVNEERLTTIVEQSIFTIPLEIFLKFSGKRLSLQIAGGIDYYRAPTNYSYSEVISGEVIPRQVKIKHEGIGWHVGLRPEVFLNENKNFSLVFEIKLFSIGLEGFPPDENGAIGEMRRFMGKDSNSIVYGLPPYVILPPGKSIFECFILSMGVKFRLARSKPIDTTDTTDTTDTSKHIPEVFIDCNNICFQVRTNNSVCIGYRDAVPGKAKVSISFNGQTSSRTAKANGSFRISCSRLKAGIGDEVEVTVTVNGVSRSRRIKAVPKCRK